jgi:hypothetical protein
MIFHVVAGRLTQSVTQHGGIVPMLPTAKRQMLRSLGVTRDGGAAEGPLAFWRGSDARLSLVGVLSFRRPVSFVCAFRIGRMVSLFFRSVSLLSREPVIFFVGGDSCRRFVALSAGNRRQESPPTIVFRKNSQPQSERRLWRRTTRKRLGCQPRVSRGVTALVPALGRRGIRVPMCGCDGGGSPF